MKLYYIKLIFIILLLNLSLFADADDNGIPETLKQRFNVVKNVLKKAKKQNFSTNDVIVDGLVMTVSSDSKAALKTFELINKCVNELKMNTIVRSGQNK